MYQYESLKTREVAASDAEQIVNLFDTVYNKSYPMEKFRDVDKVRKMLEDKRDVWHVALDGDKIIGSAAATQNSWNRTYETCRSMTHPDYAGRKVGKVLYNSVLKACYEREDCDFTFGFPRSLNMYLLLSTGIENPFLLTGYDGGMHIVNNRRENHLMGVTINPNRNLVRVETATTNKLMENRFVQEKIMSKMRFENVSGEFSEAFIVGSVANNHAEVDGLEFNYDYLSASRSLQINSISDITSNSLDAVTKAAERFFKKLPFGPEHIFSYVLVDKGEMIKKMFNLGFEIVSYLPAWYHEDGKRYDAVMMVKKLYGGEPAMYGTEEIINSFKSNFKNMSDHYLHLKSKQELSRTWASNNLKWMSPANYEPSMRKIRNILTRHIPKDTIGEAVDVGTGEGAFPLLLSELYDADIIGIDVSLESVQKAKSKLGDPDGRIKFLHVDADAYLSSRKYEWDFVSAINSLQDMYKPGDTMTLMTEALRKGGYLFFTVPDTPAVRSLERYGRLEDYKSGLCKIVLLFKKADGTSYEWSQCGFDDEWVVGRLEKNSMELLEDGRLVYDATPLAYIADFLDILEDKKTEIKILANKVLENQKINPESGPAVRYYLAKKI